MPIPLEKQLSERFGDLLKQGEALSAKLISHPTTHSYYIGQGYTDEFTAWFASAAHLIRLVSPTDSYFVEECASTSAYMQSRGTIEALTFKRMYGLLKAAQDNWQRDMLIDLQCAIAKSTFDEFLDHADVFQKQGRHMESGMLAAIVLEDTMKKIAVKNRVDPVGLTLEPLVGTLVKSGAFTKVEAKRIRPLADTRNHAVHAEWSDYTLDDAGKLIDGTRELIRMHL